jgi:hypothetical protein
VALRRREPPQTRAVRLAIVALVLVDLVFLLIVLAFFAVCVGYVRLCDRIIGPDSHPTSTAVEPDRQEATR